MQKKEKSIGINAVLNGIKTIFTLIFPLITYPYAARILQVENMGKVDFSNSIVSYFVLFAGLGISTYAIREGAGVRDNKKKLEIFSNEMFSINVFSSILALVLLVITVIFVPKLHRYSLLILVQSITIFGNLIGVTWLYTIMEDYAYITIRALIVHVLALILLFVFVHNQSDYVFYAATTVVANTGANFFNFFHARKYVNLRVTTQINWSKHIKPIFVIFASTVTTTIYVNSDKTLLGFLSDEYHVGLYSVSVNIYTVLKSLIAAVILVALPRLSNYVANNRKRDFEKTATYIFQTFMLILVPLMVGTFMIAPDIITIIGGKSYAEAGLSLQILSLSLFFSMLATFYSNAVLLPFKQEAIVLKATVVSAILNIVLNLFLLRFFQQNGAAFTTLLAEATMCIFQYFYVRKYLKFKLSFSYIIGIFVGCISIIFVVIICDIYIKGFVLNLGVKVFVSIILYFLSLFLLKNDVMMNILCMLRDKKKSL